MKKKFPKTKDFALKQIEKGVFKPSVIKEEYEKQYPDAKEKTIQCWAQAIKRLGYDKETRIEEREKQEKEQAEKDIFDYQQVQDYLKVSGRTERQKERQLHYLRELWVMMGKTNPNTWTYTDLMTCIEKHIPKIKDDRGREIFEHRGKVKLLLSPVSTMFAGKLPKGWGKELEREAGELKDHFTQEEFNEYCSALTDTEKLSLEGWNAVYRIQVNTTCREGSRNINGIMGLRWENIDYNKRRCSMKEKGGRGNASRTWKNLPMDFFPQLKAWQYLMKYHKQLFGYIPTNQKHETGRVFKSILYADYLEQFHNTRKRANGRIAGEGETLKPHIFRKTSAQWKIDYGLHLEEVCGVFPDGYYGVGWDNPAILLKYYVEMSKKRKAETDQMLQEEFKKRGYV